MPGTITALKAQKRNHQRINVYMDGEFAFGLARIVAAWLHIGQQLSDAKIAELRAEDERESAFQMAVNYLSYRERSRSELEQHLARHDVSPELSEGVLQRLKENGMLDDSRFARHWMENRNDLRPRSRRMLAFELRRKGLEDGDIQQALENLDDDDAAYRAASAYVRKLRNLDWPDFRNRLSAFLARRGFSYATAAPIVSRVWAESHAGDEPETTMEDDEVDLA